jgi:hypothetical protein
MDRNKMSDLDVIDAEAYKKLNPTEKNKPYVVLKAPKERNGQKIANITKDDILGVNKAGVLAILDDAIPPAEWMSYIFESDGEQQPGYTSVYKTQSELLAEMQHVLLEAALNGGKYSFTSPLIPKYVWAFKELKKDLEIVGNADRADRTKVGKAPAPTPTPVPVTPETPTKLSETPAATHCYHNLYQQLQI